VSEESRPQGWSADRYQVVVNDEEQYSIWPADREVPVGWRAKGMMGPKDECLAYIESVWADITPLSVRRAKQAQGR
jgi:MbtH protein